MREIEAGGVDLAGAVHGGGRRRTVARDKTRKPGKPPLPSNTVQRVVDLALGPPPGESTHWTGRELAKAAGVSLRSVQRILEAHQLAPHRIRTFKLSKNPEFVEKLRDIVGLYVDPPAHAVVLSVDEKNQIQALDRIQPGLPMKKGHAGTMTHDDKRHGTTTLLSLSKGCRPQCARRHRHRPQHAAPPAPGVHPLPQHRRGARCRCEWRSTPSKASSPNSRDGASSVECSGRLLTLRLTNRLPVCLHRPILEGEAIGASGMADKGETTPGDEPPSEEPKYDQAFFLALAAKGKEAWNAWRRDPANKDIYVTFKGADFSEAPRDQINFEGFEFGYGAQFL